jgi:hypothetical protein
MKASSNSSSVGGITRAGEVAVAPGGAPPAASAASAASATNRYVASENHDPTKGISSYAKSFKKKSLLVDGIRKCRESLSEKQIGLLDEEFKVLLEKFSFKLHRHGTPSQKLAQLVTLLRSNSAHYLDALEELVTIIGLVLHDYVKILEIKDAGQQTPQSMESVLAILRDLNIRLENTVKEIMVLKTSVFRNVRYSSKEKKEQFTRDHIQNMNGLIGRYRSMRQNFRRYLSLAETESSRHSLTDIGLLTEDETTCESECTLEYNCSSPDEGKEYYMTSSATLPPWCFIDLTSSDLDQFNLSQLNLRYCMFAKDLGCVDLRGCSLNPSQLKFVRNLTNVRMDKRLAESLAADRYRLATEMLEKVFFSH